MGSSRVGLVALGAELAVVLVAACSDEQPTEPLASTSDADKIQVSFPDSSLEAAVRLVLGKPTGPIGLGDLVALTELEAVQAGIADLSGVQQMENLLTLRIPDNAVSDISLLSALTELRFLDVSRNGVRDLSPLEALPKLSVLILNGNRIEDISPLLALPELTVLELTSNPLSTRALEVDIPLLQERGIELSYDQGETDGASAGDETVTPTETPDISDLVVFADSALADAVRDRVKLSSDALIERSDVLSLKTLDASERNIENLAGIEALMSMQELDLSGNDIEDISSLVSLNQLRKLDLAAKGHVRFAGSWARAILRRGASLRPVSVSELSPGTVNVVASHTSSSTIPSVLPSV